MIHTPNRLRLLGGYACAALISWLFTVAPATGWGAVPRLLRNINTSIVPESSNPGFLGTLNGKMLFGATDGTGPGLWSADGTSGGTTLLRRIPVFPQATYPGSPEFVVIGNRGYFVVFGSTQGAQVWSTDGTAAGTVLVADMTSSNGHIPVLYGALGTKLIFGADDANGNSQLFAANGTGGGVQPLTQFTTSGFNANTSSAIVGNKLYFGTYGLAAPGGIYGGAIWVSDGTTAGTHTVTNPLGTDAVFYAKSMTTVGTRALYYSQGKLYSIDSSSDTIAAVADSQGPVASGEQLVDMGGYVAFMGPGGVWRTDGTVAGTFSVAPAANVQYPLLQRAGNHVIFYGTDAQNNIQVMGSDLTAGNVVQLTTGSGPPDPTTPRAPYHATIAGFAYFSMSDGAQTTTWSIWRTDGTAAGTRRVGGVQSYDQTERGYAQVAGDSTATYIETFAPDQTGSLYAYDVASDTSRLLLGNFNSSPFDSFVSGSGALYFSTNDVVKGSEPWVTDGTAAGTHLIADINPEFSDSSSSPENFVAFNGKLVFSANDGVHGRELWTSDGTGPGTVLLSDVDSGATGSDPNYLFVYNNALYFFATDPNGTHNFMRLAAGAPAQILLSNLAAPSPAQGGFIACQQDTPAVLNGVAYFSATDGNSGVELWSTDGTSAGTHRVADIAPGPSSSDPCSLTVFNNHLYFFATGPGGNELWTSDGTGAGTTQVVDIAPGTAGSYPRGLTVFNDALYFEAYDGNIAQLWRSDGTPSGTTALGEIIPNQGAAPIPVGTVNGKLMMNVTTFDSQTSIVTNHLWATDGTPTGAIDLGVSPSGNVFVSQSGRAFFQGPGATGAEPWVSDATVAGTHALADINPTAQSAIQWFADFHGLTLFTVTGSASGPQLWRSDGTATGTTLISTVAPPPTPMLATASNHLQLAVGNQFFLAGSDPTVGSELYGLTLGLPSGTADTASSNDDQQLTINVLSNDSDADGTLNPASVSVVTPAAHGTVTAGANGALVYTPTSGFAGTDTFSYTVGDDQGATSSPTMVTITVTAAAATPPPSAGGSTGGGGGGGALGVLELFGLLACGGLRLSRRPPSAGKKGATHSVVRRSTPLL